MRTVMHPTTTSIHDNSSGILSRTDMRLGTWRVVWLIISALFILPGVGMGQESPVTSPETVRVGFYLLSAGRLDLERSDLPLDFYLWLNHNGSETPSFEFINSRDARIVSQTMQANSAPGAAYAFTTTFRVTGHFEQDLDMSLYPFERHRVQVILEDTNADLTRRLYVADVSGTAIDPMFQIVGWNIDGCDVRVATHSYSSSFGVVGAPLQDYAQVVASLTISRPHGLMFIKTFIPALLFLVIAMMGLTFPNDNLNQKIGLGVAALFSSVAYHVNLTRNIPPVGYLTFIDRLMIGQYVILFLTLLTAIFTYTACRAECTHLANAFAWVGRLLIPTLTVSLYLIQLSGILSS